MKRAKKAERRPVAETKRPLRGKTDSDENVLTWAHQLRGLGVDVAELLERAYGAEQIFLSQPEAPRVPAGRYTVRRVTRDIAEALHEYGAGILYSPSFLDELWGLSAVCRSSLGPGHGDKSAREAQHLLMRVSVALRSPSPAFVALARHDRARAALALATQVQTEAERLARSKPATFARSGGKPNLTAEATARSSVARNAGLSVEAMQARIRRAAKDSPRAPWPEIMPRPRKNRQA